jgi:hypothetical protein
MKPTFIILALACGLGSCGKDNGPSIPVEKNSLLGKWTVEKDSFQMDGFGANNMKTDSDYYDFENSGLLLVKEGTTVDTATYTLGTGNSVGISWIGKIVVNRLSGNYLINTTSANPFTLTASGGIRTPIIPEGSSGQAKVIVSLKK